MIHPDQSPMFRFRAIMTAASMVGFTINHMAAVFLPAQFMRSHHDPDKQPEAVLPVYTSADTEKA